MKKEKIFTLGKKWRKDLISESSHVIFWSSRDPEKEARMEVKMPKTEQDGEKKSKENSTFPDLVVPDHLPER